MEKKLESKPICNKKKKKLKSKMKSYLDDTTHFHGKKNPKVSSNYTCLVVILIGFFLKRNENYYPQVLLKLTLKKDDKIYYS